MTRPYTLCAPAPIWPEAPRLCSGRPLPAYRYVPGLNVHPLKHPQGHSYGHQQRVVRLSPVRWRQDQDYLFGIDLYHQAYFWEAHETWEGIWQLSDKQAAQGQFLQALIQNSAAQLKAHLNEPVGTRRLCRAVLKRLRFVCNSGHQRYMGIELADLLEQVERHYGPMLTGEPGPLRRVGRPPRLTAEP